jgi:hypothetical protein
VKSIGERKYFVSFVDDFTGLVHVELMEKKSDVPALFMNFYNLTKVQMGKEIKKIRLDGGGEYLGKFKRICEDLGIKREVTTPHSPWQNGRAERLNRTLLEGARSMLIARSLSSSLWTLAVAHLSAINNQVLKDKDKSKIDLEKDKIFGKNCYYYAHKKTKLSSKVLSGIYVGNEGKGIKILQIKVHW